MAAGDEPQTDATKQIQTSQELARQCNIYIINSQTFISRMNDKNVVLLFSNRDYEIKAAHLQSQTPYIRTRSCGLYAIDWEYDILLVLNFVQIREFLISKAVRPCNFCHFRAADSGLHEKPNDHMCQTVSEVCSQLSTFRETKILGKKLQAKTTRGCHCPLGCRRVNKNQ